MSKLLATHTVATSVRRLTIEHITITTSRLYCDVKRHLEERLGRLDEQARSMVRSGDIQGARARLQAAAGVDGLAIHYIGIHGEWLALMNGRQNATSYLIGNVLYAVQMTSVELAAGLYAPLRIMMYEHKDSGTCIEYDKPSTLFGQFGRSEIDSIAAILDEKLHSLLLKVCTDEKDSA